MDRIFKVFQSQTEAEKPSIVKQPVLDPDSTEYEAMTGHSALTLSLAKILSTR